VGLLDNITLLVFDIVADDEEEQRRRRGKKGQKVAENEKVNQGEPLDVRTASIFLVSVSKEMPDG
jgi:hypothetical protein